MNNKKNLSNLLVNHARKSRFMKELSCNTHKHNKKTELRNLLGKEQKLTLEAILCPPYDEKGGLITDGNIVEQLSPRLRNKIDATVSTLGLMKEHFDLDVHFTLADKGILVRGNGNNNSSIISDTNHILDNYTSYIQESISDFTIGGFPDDFSIALGGIKEYTAEECYTLLNEYGIVVTEKIKKVVEGFKNQYGGYELTHHLMSSYLQHSKYLYDTYAGTDKAVGLLTAESVASLHRMYDLGENRATDALYHFKINT